MWYVDHDFMPNACMDPIAISPGMCEGRLVSGDRPVILADDYHNRRSTESSTSATRMRHLSPALENNWCALLT